MPLSVTNGATVTNSGTIEGLRSIWFTNGAGPPASPITADPQHRLGPDAERRRVQRVIQFFGPQRCGRHHFDARGIGGGDHLRPGTSGLIDNRGTISSNFAIFNSGGSGVYEILNSGTINNAFWGVSIGSTVC
jgi:hypothetical protein